MSSHVCVTTCVFVFLVSSHVFDFCDLAPSHDRHIQLTVRHGSRRLAVRHQPVFAQFLAMISRLAPGRRGRRGLLLQSDRLLVLCPCVQRARLSAGATVIFALWLPTLCGCSPRTMYICCGESLHRVSSCGCSECSKNILRMIWRKHWLSGGVHWPTPQQCRWHCTVQVRSALTR